MPNNANKVNSNPMKVITGPETRWSFANVWEPKAINGGTPKYSVSLIIPKSDTRTVAKIKAAIEAAYREGEAKLKGNGRTVPPLAAIKTPCVTGTSNGRTIPPMPMPTSSMPTPQPRLALWMPIVNPSSIAPRFTAASTAEQV